MEIQTYEFYAIRFHVAVGCADCNTYKILSLRLQSSDTYRWRLKGEINLSRSTDQPAMYGKTKISHSWHCVFIVISVKTTISTSCCDSNTLSIALELTNVTWKRCGLAHQILSVSTSS
jgi:hypothetical protein